MSKKTIVHIERDTTKAGRTINALLGLLTANRYALIFTLKVTLVKRNYQPERMRQRALENLFIAVILFPLAMGVVLGLKKCGYDPPYFDILPSDSITNQSHTPINTPAQKTDPIYEAVAGR